MPLHELAEKRDEFLKKISSSGSHLLSLIEDILDITRIDNGQMRLNEQSFLVLDVISECVSMLEGKAEALAVSIHVDATCDTGLSISTDRVRFKQILVNLLSNAVKYNKPSGLVDISYLGTPDGRVVVNVRDTGIGMAQQDLEKAFEPFSRLQRDGSEIEGTGIGLTITKQLTELMNGEISVESSLGEGTSITVNLPLTLDCPDEFLATGTT